MILADSDDSWIAINQNEHAALAAQFLSLWIAGGLPEAAHRSDLLIATRHHDDGWLEADSAPRCREDGIPHDFRSMLDDDRLGIWITGVARHAERRDRIPLIITQHALYLHQDPPPTPDWSKAIQQWQSFRAKLLDELDMELETLEKIHHWLALADTLSLAACGRWTQPINLPGLNVVPSDEGSIPSLRLDPFPLKGATTFEYRARQIPKRRYEGDTDLAMQLVTARWQKLRVRLEP